MDIDKVVNNIMQIASTKKQSNQTSKITLPDNTLGFGEFAHCLNVLADQYKTTLPSLIRKLDSVSGNLDDLDKYYRDKDEKVCWNEEQDNLLLENKEKLLIRWKGLDSVQRRKKYLNWKEK